MASYFVLYPGNGIADLAFSLTAPVTRVISNQPPITDVILLVPN
jgi:hypothetical protein